MASDMWLAGDDVMNTLKDIVSKHHPDLAMHHDEILVVFKEKATEVDGTVIIGKSSKASPLLALASGKAFKFVITLGADEWGRLNALQQKALLDHHLCACRSQENDQTGKSKFWIQPADVSFYEDEIRRHGFWRTSGAAATDGVMTELFGPDVP
jgi:hypothetical protein